MPRDRAKTEAAKAAREARPGAEPDPGLVGTRAWNELLGLLRKHSGTDFSGYRSTTLQRRLQKRMEETLQPDLEAYLAHVRRNPEELQALHSAFLIKVSAFLRDPEAWRQLRDTVAKPLAKAMAGGKDVRIWCAGCATGEEAYSLAITFLDLLPASARGRFKLFATDVDEDVLAVARQGRYESASLKNLTRPQVQRYFVPEAGQFKIRKEVRQHVIFGRHDVTKDPPIVGLDLLCCRNVLIYLNPAQKQQVLTRYSYAIKPGGFLFLGKSEGAHLLRDGFRIVSSRGHILERVATHYEPPRASLLVRPGRARTIEAEVMAGRREAAAHEGFQHLLLQSASILLFAVDKERRVTLWNRATEEAFRVKASQAMGEYFYDVMDGISDDRLNAAIKRCLRDGVSARVAEVKYAQEGRAERYFSFDCSPFAGGGVLFVGQDTTVGHDAEQRQKELARQLRKTASEAAAANESLQATNEELETLNEEVQSSSEEYQTLNEELQSRNEELETVNEELQSANEELSTLNEEMRVRSDELERMAGYLRGFLDSSADGIVMVGAENRVLFWNRMAVKLFRLSESQAVGQDLYSVVPSLDTPLLRSAARQVLADAAADPVRDIPVATSEDLSVSVHPVVGGTAGRAAGYLLMVSRSDGADVEKHLKTIASSVRDPMLLVGEDGGVREANAAARRVFGKGLRGSEAVALRDLLPRSVPAGLRADGRRPLVPGDYAVRLPPGSGRRACKVSVVPASHRPNPLYVVLFALDGQG